MSRKSKLKPAPSCHSRNGKQTHTLLCKCFSAEHTLPDTSGEVLLPFPVPSGTHISEG